MIEPLPIPYWKMDVWDNDAKSNHVATIDHIAQYQGTMALGAPYTFTAYCWLSDRDANVLQARAGDGNTGQYVELKAGRTNSKTLIASGYVNKVTKTIDTSGMYQVDFDSASIVLTYYRALDAFLMPYPRYKNVIHALNGVIDPKNRSLGRGATHGHFGMLPSTAKAHWIDPVWWKAHKRHGGHPPPGHGDSWFTALETAQLNLQTIAARYNFSTRERPGSTISNLHIDCGPLGDWSGLHIWGGESLRQTLSQDAANSTFNANAAIAQRHGLAIIDQPQFVSSRDQVINVAWGPGAGSVSTGLVSLHSLWKHSPDAPRPGGGYIYEKYVDPGNGRTYWLGDAKKDWEGSDFRLIASQRQDASWEFGCINETSKSKYGLREDLLTRGNKKISDVEQLLAACAGMVSYFGDPVDTFVFPVIHPRTSDSGVPHRVLPGQRVKVSYKGSMPGYKVDDNPTSDTYGQLIETGEIDYLDFPGTTDDLKIRKLERVIQVDESYDANNGYQQTLTMGHGKVRLRHWQDEIARGLEHETYRIQNRQTFGVPHDIGHTPWVFSQNPDAWWDEHGLHLQPDATAVSDAHNHRFFGDHKSLSYLTDIHGWDQMVDTWIGKDLNTDIGNPDPGNESVYVIFRLAMHGSGWKTGFYKVQSGAVVTHKGWHPHRHLDKHMVPDRWHVTVSFHNGVYHAHLHRLAETTGHKHHHHHISSWHDNAFEVPWDQTKGQIGFHLLGGKVNARVNHLRFAGR